MHHHHSSRSSLAPVDRLARNLGWFSIGLGICQLIAPGLLTRNLGIDEDKKGFVRLCGGREILSGLGALTPNPTPAIWGRVGGDIADLVGLASLYHDRNPKKANVGMALAAVATATAVDVYCAKSLSKRHAYQAGPTPDYSHRSGFPRSIDEMRGAALKDSEDGNGDRGALPSPAMVGRTPSEMDSAATKGGEVSGADTPERPEKKR